jgi:hypothetical protein
VATEGNATYVRVRRWQGRLIDNVGPLVTDDGRLVPDIAPEVGEMRCRPIVQILVRAKSQTMLGIDPVAELPGARGVGGDKELVAVVVDETGSHTGDGWRPEYGLAEEASKASFLTGLMTTSS